MILRYILLGSSESKFWVSQAISIEFSICSTWKFDPRWSSTWLSWVLIVCTRVRVWVWAQKSVFERVRSKRVEQSSSGSTQSVMSRVAGQRLKVLQFVVGVARWRLYLSDAKKRSKTDKAKEAKNRHWKRKWAIKLWREAWTWELRETQWHESHTENMDMNLEKGCVDS